MKKFLMVLAIMAVVVTGSFAVDYAYGPGPVLVSANPVNMFGFCVLSTTASSGNVYFYDCTLTAQIATTPCKLTVSAANVECFQLGNPSISKFAMGVFPADYVKFNKGIIVDAGVNTLGVSVSGSK